MPRVRKAADDVTVIRKRAQRRIASLQKAGYTQSAKYLQDLLRATYQKQQGPAPLTSSTKSIAADRIREQSIERLKNAVQVAPTTRQARQNMMFRREMNLASAGFETSFGEVGKQKVKLFWAATRDIWAGLPNDARIPKILERFKTSSLEEAFNRVMTVQVEAYAKALGQVSAGWTDQSPEFIQALSEHGDDEKGVTKTYRSVR